MRGLIFLVAMSTLFYSQLTAQASAPKLLPFQGRLTDQNGQAISNGVQVVQFKIYSVPTGGSPVWAGEVHRTTVNGGLINVMLGTKTPLEGVDFNQQLYLEVTVDSSGPGGVPDGAITSADPPMLPRQVILPLPFAKESAESRKLAGHDWSDLLVSGNDPSTGFLRGDKLQAGSVGAAQIQPKTITGLQIADGSISSQQISDATITAAKLSAELVLDSIVPAGAIIAFGGETPPPGWLLCDGRPMTSGQWPRLYSAIGTNWGAGNLTLGGTNDFNLPDLRGVFLRGVNGARTTFIQVSTNLVDPDAKLRTNGPAGGKIGNAVGSLQEDQLKTHIHTYETTPTLYADRVPGTQQIGPNGGVYQYVTYSTNPSGGAETRPRNAYVNYIIKY